MMMERGGSGVKDIETLQTYAGRIVQYHAQYADRALGTFNATLAAFLAGMDENAFYGAGG
jgi:hypothetical protein